MMKIKLERIKQIAAVQFGYQPYFDEFNHYRLIKPKNSNATLDRFLDPYADEVILNDKECMTLSAFINDLNMGKGMTAEAECENAKIRDDINTLRNHLIRVDIGNAVVRIDNHKGELSYAD